MKEVCLGMKQIRGKAIDEKLIDVSTSGSTNIRNESVQEDDSDVNFTESQSMKDNILTGDNMDVNPVITDSSGRKVMSVREDVIPQDVNMIVIDGVQYHIKRG